MFQELPPFSVEITFYNDNFESESYRAALCLRNLGVDVLGKYTVSRENASMLDAVERWSAQHGIPFLFDPVLFNGENGVDAKSQAVDDKVLVNLNVRRYGLDYGNEKTVCAPLRSLQCKAADRAVFLSPELELSVCPDMKHRWATAESGFDEAYRRMRSWIARIRDIPIEGYSGCADRPLCTMCTAHSELIESPQGIRVRVPEKHCREVAALGEKMRKSIKQRKGD